MICNSSLLKATVYSGETSDRSQRKGSPTLTFQGKSFDLSNLCPRDSPNQDCNLLSTQKICDRPARRESLYPSKAQVESLPDAVSADEAIQRASRQYSSPAGIPKLPERAIHSSFFRAYHEVAAYSQQRAPGAVFVEKHRGIERKLHEEVFFPSTTSPSVSGSSFRSPPTTRSANLEEKTIQRHKQSYSKETSKSSPKLPGATWIEEGKEDIKGRLLQKRAGSRIDLVKDPKHDQYATPKRSSSRSSFRQSSSLEHFQVSSSRPGATWVEGNDDIETKLQEKISPASRPRHSSQNLLIHSQGSHPGLNDDLHVISKTEASRVHQESDNHDNYPEDRQKLQTEVSSTFLTGPQAPSSPKRLPYTSPSVNDVQNNLPNQDTSSPPLQIEIAPDSYMPLRGTTETMAAIECGAVIHVACILPSCGERLLCIEDAELVICPSCHSLTPLGCEPGSGRRGGVGLGLVIGRNATTRE